MPFPNFFICSSDTSPKIRTEYSLSTSYFGCIILLANSPLEVNIKSPEVLKSKRPIDIHFAFLILGKF